MTDIMIQNTGTYTSSNSHGGAVTGPNVYGSSSSSSSSCEETESVCSETSHNGRDTKQFSDDNMLDDDVDDDLSVSSKTGSMNEQEKLLAMTNRRKQKKPIR